MFWIAVIHSVSPDSLKATVRYLSSPDLEGRFTGSRGEKLARDYIVKKLRSYGYDVKVQEFKALVGLDVVEYERRFFFFRRTKTYLRVGDKSYKLREDFLPLNFSENGEVRSKVVFAGWGISDSTRDEYEGLDVRGKIVMLLRYAPPDGRYDGFASLPTKLRIAREKGAKAVIVVNPPDYEDVLRPLKARDIYSSGIVAVMVKRKVAEEILGRPIDSLYERLLKGERVNFEVEKEVSLGVELRKRYAKTANVIAVLRGKSDRWIGLGAHYDHLGWGGPGSGSLRPDTHAVHPGADDNSSGVAAVLEIARIYSGRTPEKTLLFMFWSGEELGLLGSKHYVEHPILPLEKGLVYINYDMVGRMRDSTLSVLGAYSGKGLDSLMYRAFGRRGVKVKLGVGAVGPSDHTSFYLKGVPVAHIFTGAHEDYHKPTDTPDKVNYAALSLITEVSMELLDTLTSLERVEYVKVKEQAPRGGRMGKLRVKLGIIPAYASREEGVKVEGVVPGRPAEIAGIMAGDVIVSIGGKRIANIYDYIDVLKRYRPGDSTVVVVNRGGELVELKVLFPK